MGKFSVDLPAPFSACSVSQNTSPASAHPESSADIWSLTGTPIVAVMGPTGSGKSTFIRVATGVDDAQIGDALRSCTQKIQGISCHNPSRGSNILFIDTPGFDDTFRADVEILEELAHWLGKIYQAGVKLSGILYFHRITDNRMSGTLLRNLNLFLKLCGTNALSNVTLVTTHWDQLRDIERGIRNEEELRNEYWKPFLASGSQMMRFEYTCSSAWDIINSLPLVQTPLDIQREMMDQRNTLPDMAARRTLIEWFTQVNGMLKEFIRRLEFLMKKVTSSLSGDTGNVEREKKLKEAKAALKALEKQELRLRRCRSDPSLICDRPESSIRRRLSQKFNNRRASVKNGAQSLGLDYESVCDIPDTDSFVEAATFTDPSSSASKLTYTLQTLKLARATVIGIPLPSLGAAVGIALRIAESLIEMRDTHQSLVVLMDNAGRFINAISIHPCPEEVNIVIDEFCSQLRTIEQITKKIKSTSKLHQYVLQPDDQRAILDCNDAMKLALQTLSDSPSQTKYSSERGLTVLRNIFDNIPIDPPAGPLSNGVPIVAQESSKKANEIPKKLRRLCDLTAEIAWSKHSRRAFTDMLSKGKEIHARAQAVADYLNFILHDTCMLKKGDRENILWLFYELAGSAEVYPRCYILEQIHMDTHPLYLGGFADVYKGQYKGQIVCCKVLRLPGDNNRYSSILRTFAKEIILWAHSSHENILPFYGIHALGDSIQRISLVSPWMKNGNLRQYLKNSPGACRVSLVQDIIEGLVYLHESKVVHGDLKPENILVSDDGQALITDFGLSFVAVSVVTRFGQSPSTAGGVTSWMAPELLSGATSLAKSTQDSDIWSFGCVCYETFTGRYPFYHYGSSPQVILALLRGEIPCRPKPGDNLVCAEFEDWTWEMMLGCWKMAPQDRYTGKAIRELLKLKIKPSKHLKTSKQLKEDSALRDAIKTQSEVLVDYQLVENILVEFLSSHREGTVAE